MLPSLGEGGYADSLAPHCAWCLEGNAFFWETPADPRRAFLDGHIPDTNAPGRPDGICRLEVAETPATLIAKLLRATSRHSTPTDWTSLGG